MGIRFPLNYANLLAFFTTGLKTLECSARDLRGFFYMLEQDEWRLITSEDDSVWPQKIRKLAQIAGGIVDKYVQTPAAIFDSPLSEARHLAMKKKEITVLEDVQVSIREVFGEQSGILHKLSDLFRESHDLFVLGIAVGSQAELVREFLEKTLYSTKSPVSILFLIPDPDYEAPLDFMNPFPGAWKICQYPERWPGTLIWNRTGNSVFLPLTSAREALANLAFLEKMATSLSADEIIAMERQYVPPPPANRARILHLSDLHFGTKYATKNQSYLLAVIREELQGQFERIVITGDLFDSPWKRKWQAFENFQTALRLLTPTDPIVISGNHDQRIVGNAVWRLGSSYKYLAELGGRLVYEDERLRCLFFCFNSSKTGNFARGEVLTDDLVRMATEYHVLASRTPDIKNWLKVALVHHHPFKFDSTAEGSTAKLLKALKIPEGKLLDMAESERFICWCADRGVQLILHGHRHVQRKITQVVPVDESGGAAVVTALGCGTSLGAEGVPASFNLVTWDPNTQRWATVFYRDHHGGGFKPLRAISTTLNPLDRIF